MSVALPGSFARNAWTASRACSVGLGWVEVHGGGLGDVGCKPFAQGLGIVCVNAGIVRGAGDGDVGKPGVDEAPR